MGIQAASRRRIIRYIIGTTLAVLFLHIFIHSFEASPPRNRIQHNFPTSSTVPRSQPDRQRAVKKQFLHAWRGYQDHAFMSDSLMSLSGGRKDQFCGWSATLVDSLDTLYIMNLHEEFEEAINATLSIDFAHNSRHCTVSLFESTIRYLGGMLAAYDLSQDARLLPKLVELGDTLHSAFDTWNGMPCSFCHLGAEPKEAYSPSQNVAMADVGSLILEFGRLSQITSDSKYLTSVMQITDVFHTTQNDSSIPGLWPEMVDASSVTSSDIIPPGFATKSHTFSLGALSDSSYEYLVKAHLFLGANTSIFSRMWDRASTQIRRYMLFRAFLPDITSENTSTNILFSGVASRWPGAGDVILEPRTQHLACFAGGMFAMASRIFNTDADFSIGEGLTNGCVWAYTHSPLGIMPETFSLLPCSDLDSDPDTQCLWNQTLWDHERASAANCNLYAGSGTANCSSKTTLPAGILKVGAPEYVLRPEAIESVFIMWRMTGDPSWRDIGWDMFEHIIEHTRTPYGHAAIHNVLGKTAKTAWRKGQTVMSEGAVQRDDMESFWLAETLKYFYLLFSEPSLVSLDDWVLNTEAHPFRLTDGLRGF